jgi:predicted DCC family thiol-disulfide oxidoreductase YuxK
MSKDKSLAPGQRIILFDGVCNLCNSSVNFIIDRDPKGKFRFAALQSDVGQKLLLENSINATSFDSIVLISEGKIFQKSTAALKIAKELSRPWLVVYYMFIWVPTFIRDFFYNIIAANRYKIFGRSEACRIPTPELKSRFL